MELKLEWFCVTVSYHVFFFMDLKHFTRMTLILIVLIIINIINN